MIRLQTPISEDQVRGLTLGESVLLSGVIVTARDQGHKMMVEEKPDFLRPLLKESVIYHCGPVVRREKDGSWRFVSAGPTTSIREEPYQSDVICEYGVRGVIGKGGMGDRTSKGLEQCGAVYLHAVGGAGTLIANSVVRVRDVHMLEEFGTPEAFWVIEVRDFPLVVTMDASGNSLHSRIRDASSAVARSLLNTE